MDKETGNRARGLRAALGLSQVLVARRAGITQPSLSNIERGKTDELRGPTLTGLCKALNTNPDYLLTGKGTPGPLSIVHFEEKELLDLWASLDEPSKNALITTARALHARQLNEKPTALNPFAAKKVSYAG